MICGKESKQDVGLGLSKQKFLNGVSSRRLQPARMHYERII